MRIFFGEREEEDEELKISHEERFKQLEAKQREREGLVELGNDPFWSQDRPTVAPPRHQGVPGPAPDSNSSRKDLIQLQIIS